MLSMGGPSALFSPPPRECYDNVTRSPYKVSCCTQQLRRKVQQLATSPPYLKVIFFTTPPAFTLTVRSERQITKLCFCFRFEECSSWSILSPHQGLKHPAPARTLCIPNPPHQAWKGDGKGGTDIGFGASVYPAAYVLAEYLERHPYLVRGKRVIELGL